MTRWSTEAYAMLHPNVQLQRAATEASQSRAEGLMQHGLEGKDIADLD